MSNVVQLGAKLDQFQSDMSQAGDIAVATHRRSTPPIFWIVRAALPGQTKPSLAAFDDSEDAAAHVTWLVPRAVGKITTYECTVS